MTVRVWVTLVVGIVGFGGVIATLLQRERSESRAEWWRRVTWATDHTLSENEEAQEVGFSTIERLLDSKLMTPEEHRLASVFAERRILDDESVYLDNGSQELPQGGEGAEHE